MKESIEAHYEHGDLLNSIAAAFAALGQGVDDLTAQNLAPLDEFHIGGRPATERLVQQLNIGVGAHLLDIGCGIGGAARFVAETFAAQVTGIDLTKEFITAGQILNQWVGCDGQITLQHGSALAMPFADEQFSGAYMLHVGMNIGAKAALFTEVARLLKPGGRFALYDVMRIGDGDFDFPVPWATDPSLSFVVTKAEYEAALNEAGLTVIDSENRRAFAIDIFAAQRARQVANDGPAPLGLHIILGDRAKAKFGNMIKAIQSGILAPVEIICAKV